MSVTAHPATIIVDTRDVLVVDGEGKNLVCKGCKLASGHNSTFRDHKLPRHLADHEARGHKVPTKGEAASAEQAA